jgi:chloride channel protein, CIC family
MTRMIRTPAIRFRLWVGKLLGRLGFGEQAFLLLLAVVVGVVTSIAAVGFHELINLLRDLCYSKPTAEVLYGKGMILLIAFPAAGGLAVGLINRLLADSGKGHGVVDVIESVLRSSGFQPPRAAIETMVTSALTIGSGGSVGAEGPIVQIGAAIASGVASVFRLARQYMPVLTGCGCAAGISAIFNAPFGGVLFTLEVILQDFSIRAFTPIVVASVIAQVSTLAIFQFLDKIGRAHEQFHAIFEMPQQVVMMHQVLDWPQVGNFVLLGLVCGMAGLALTRSLEKSEGLFQKLPVSATFRPALGGAMLGVMGVFFVLIFGRLLLHRIKPFDYAAYPPPAFFGDGYGAVQQLLVNTFPGYEAFSGKLLVLVFFMCLIKIVATCLTLSSGGVGGVIAPSLFIGATAGSFVGMILRYGLHLHSIQPELYALVGMGAVLAAVIHAPLASILIVFELTQDYKVILPAMLACIVATACASYFFPDSIYTHGLRSRGVPIRGPGDFNLLRRLTIQDATMDPAPTVRASDPFQKLLDISASTGAVDFVVVDKDEKFVGMIVAGDLQTALVMREAVPLLACVDLVRVDLPAFKQTADLASVLDGFARFDVNRLPVTTDNPNHVIGLISRAALMRRYQQGLVKV